MNFRFFFANFTFIINHNTCITSGMTTIIINFSNNIFFAISWYCNEDCQKKHWNIHKKRCCNKDGPLDEGYQKISLLKK